MTTRQSFLAIVFAVCLAQAAFLAAVVANLKGANRRATTILALFILCFLPMIGEEFIEVSQLVDRFPHVIASSTTLDYVIAPLLLFYAWSLTQRERPIVRRDLLHFVPFTVAVLLLVPFYASSGADKLMAFDSGLPVSLRIVITGKIVMGAVYLTVTIRHLRRFVRRANPAEARDPNVVWLLRSMLGLAGLAVVSLVVGLLMAAGIPVPIDSDALGIFFMGGSVYLISFLLIRHPFTTADGQAVTLAQLVVPRPRRPKYQTSPLNAVQKQQYLDQLVRHMASEKPFLDMQLSLERLAHALAMRPEYLSQVINERLEMNFYEFVNEHRVREAQARIVQAAQSQKTLLAIAHESGFNSKASFNRAFKRVTGQTPSDYAKSHSIE